MTGRDIIKAALRKIGAIASGEDATAQEYADALQTLNMMIEAWDTEHLMIYTTQPQEFPLTTEQTYTLGPGGDFNTVRPPFIDRAVLKVLSNPVFPLELPLKTYTDGEWASITLKSLENTYPEGYWDNGNFPLRTLYFWPVPIGSSQLSVVLYCWQVLDQFSTLNDTHTFPPGYAKAIVYNLAIELAPEYERNPSPLVLSVAAESKAKIQILNSEPPILTCDRAIQSPSTIPGVSRADFLGGRF